MYAGMELVVGSNDEVADDTRGYMDPHKQYALGRDAHDGLTQMLHEVRPDRPRINMTMLEESVRLFFEGIGDDITRDGIKDTPKRVAKMWAETMNGYTLSPDDYVTTFDNDEGYDGPVILRDAEFYTVCEHHLQPFAGTLDLAYQPGNRILGLSKLLRVARVYAKRPQVQERLTKQVSGALNDLLEPTWVVVRIKAEHHCMKLRGVRINGSYTVTQHGHGRYPDNVFNT